MIGIDESVRAEEWSRQSGALRQMTPLVMQPARAASANEPINEVAFSDLRAGDTLLIYTENSRYSFTILDPIEHHGTLAGAALGSSEVSASLVAAQDKPGGGFDVDCAKLRAGARLMCLIASGKGLRRVTTSRVLRLIHIKGSQRFHIDSTRN